MYYVTICPVIFYENKSVNPLTEDKILDRSKWKQSADDNFEFDVNSKSFSKLVKNTVGIAGYKQFLLFPQCFQKACSQGHQKVSLCGNRLNDHISL